MKLVFLQDDGNVVVEQIAEVVELKDWKQILNSKLDEVTVEECLAGDWIVVEGKGFAGIDCGECGMFVAEDDTDPEIF